MSHPLRVTIHTSGRAKSYSFMYFRMCANSLIRYRVLADCLNTIHELDPKYELIFEQVEEMAVNPVIYAGMCLEATLYDLYACLFGEDFVAHTDKLDPVGKFFNLAMLVDKREPDKSSTTYQHIQALITARNKLVHHKSQAMQNEQLLQIMAQADKDHQKHIRGITASFRALVLLSLYFDGNIFEELRILPSFKKTEYWQSVVPYELHSDVEWCIQASKEEKTRSTCQSLPS